MRRRNHACRRILWILLGPEEWKESMIEGTLCQESNRMKPTLGGGGIVLNVPRIYCITQFDQYWIPLCISQS